MTVSLLPPEYVTGVPDAENICIRKYNNAKVPLLRVEKDLLPSGVKESRRLKWMGMSHGRLDLYYEVGS